MPTMYGGRWCSHEDQTILISILFIKLIDGINLKHVKNSGVTMSMQCSTADQTSSNSGGRTHGVMHTFFEYHKSYASMVIIKYASQLIWLSDNMTCAIRGKIVRGVHRGLHPRSPE